MMRAYHCVFMALLIQHPAAMSRGVTTLENYEGAFGSFKVFKKLFPALSTPLFSKLEKGFLESFPVRLDKVLMISMPWFLKSLMSGYYGLKLAPKSLRERMTPCSIEQVRNHVDVGCLGAELGGTEEAVDLDAWVAALPARS